MLHGFCKYHHHQIVGVWDVTKISQNAGSNLYTLSSGNTVATPVTTLSSYCWVASTAGYATGKHAAVVTIPTSNDNGFVGFGSYVSAAALWTAAPSYPGNANRATIGECMAIFPFFGSHYWTDATSQTQNVPNTGSITGTQILVAFDGDNKNFYFYNYPSNTLIQQFSSSTFTAGQVFYITAATGGAVANTHLDINAGQTTITLPAALVALGFNAFW